MNILNSPNGWQATASFVEKWFIQAFFVNKNVHFHQIWEIWEIKQIKLIIKDNRAYYRSLSVAKTASALWILQCYIQTHFPIIPVLSVCAPKYWDQIFIGQDCQKTLDQAGKCILKLDSHLSKFFCLFQW